MLLLPYLILAGAASASMTSSPLAARRQSRQSRHRQAAAQRGADAAVEPLASTSSSSAAALARANHTPEPALSARELGEWTYQGCHLDSLSRVLTAYSFTHAAMVPAGCISVCGARGYDFAGIEGGATCYCGATLGLATQALPDAACEALPCGGGGVGCGLTGSGQWALSLWARADPAPIVVPSSNATGAGGAATSSSPGSASQSGASPSSTAASSASASSSLSTASSASSSTTAYPSAAAASSTAASSAAAAPAATLPPIPWSSATKYVWAHHIVGNTYSYDEGTWLADISAASGAGVDGFVLNVGTDSWQPAQVASAYAAAAASGTGFKMMLSFDMSAIACGDASSVPLLQAYLDTYLAHGAAAQVDGRPALTTFAGEACTFGAGSLDAGWAAVLGARDVYFMPDFNSDPKALAGDAIDADVNWGAAWPGGGSDIDTSNDAYFMSVMGGKKYVATVSPLFSTHLSYKNWIWRSDDFLFAQRWEQIIGMRDKIDQVEVISWNDYGESHYIGDIRADMPDGAAAYVDNYPHTAMQSLNAFYASAWRNGYWPSIDVDQAWVMARPHPAGATAWGDAYGAPTGRENTADNVYAQVHLAAAATVTLCAGASCTTTSAGAGIHRLAQPLAVGAGVSVSVTRGGQAVLSVTPDYTFEGSPQAYNFNYMIQSS